MSEIQESNKKAYDVNIFNNVSLAEQEYVVSNIVDGLFEFGYSPVRYTYVFWKEIMRAYTDFDVVNIAEDELCDLIETSQIVTAIKEKVRSIQLDNIENAVDEMIAARLSKSEMDIFWADARTLLKKVDGLVSSLDPKLIQKVMTKFSKMDEKKIVQWILELQKKGTSDVKDVKQ